MLTAPDTPDRHTGLPTTRVGPLTSAQAKREFRAEQSCSSCTMSNFVCTTWVKRSCGQSCCRPNGQCTFDFCDLMVVNRSSCAVQDCFAMLNALHPKLHDTWPAEHLSNLGFSRQTRALLNDMKTKRIDLSVGDQLFSTWNASLSIGIEAAQSIQSDHNLWLEFGAASGRSTLHIASRRSTRGSSGVIHSFDSFYGLPEPWRMNFPRGAFSSHGKVPFHDRRIHWIKGLFNDTLPSFLASHPNRSVSFVHIDCDIFSSADLVFRLIESRLSPNAVIVLDDLLNYPGYSHGELKALDNMFMRTGREATALGMTARSILPDTPYLLKLFRRYGEGMMSFMFPQQAVIQLH